MAELLAHLFGDFPFQNHLMATRKPVSTTFAAVHVAIYTAWFIAWTDASAAALFVIAATHFLIDRFRLARYWVEFYGVGCEGWIVRTLRERGILKVDPIEPAPPLLVLVLLIVVDNTFHLAINNLALTWL